MEEARGHTQPYGALECCVTVMGDFGRRLGYYRYLSLFPKGPGVLGLKELRSITPWSERKATGSRLLSVHLTNRGLALLMYLGRQGGARALRQGRAGQGRATADSVNNIAAPCSLLVQEKGGWYSVVVGMRWDGFKVQGLRGIEGL